MRSQPRRRRRVTLSEGSPAFTERFTERFADRGGRSPARSDAAEQHYHHHHHHHHIHANTAASLIASPTPRSICNYNPLARSSRTSSQKVHQLTGLQVDVMDNQLMSPASVSSDTSSTRSDTRMDDYGVPDYHLVPVLEADDDESSSRGSSWGPMSPETDAMPAPLNIIHRPIADGNDKRMDGLGESFPQMTLDDDVVRPCWGGPAHGQFSDIAAAGEYHRFTANLATRHSRQLSAVDDAAPSTTSSRKKRSSLSLALSAATRFSRRRERPDSIDTSSSSTWSTWSAGTHQDSPKPPRQSPADFVAGPAYSSSPAPATPRLAIDVAPPRPSPAPPLRSAWDSDSESDEMPAMSSLKDWFGQRASEENKGHRQMSSASGMRHDQKATGPRPGDRRELLTRLQQREQQIKREKAAKRREQRKEDFKKSFAKIPEEFVFSPPRFL
ncbi:hypothetical protein C2857_005049 [Epichloe festucae Fl1]|uniref:Uncharacterized protein n=1 Tax=Epichloe festucae (strain Fl1) TaxID=877507 RepID=A0A7S9KSJ9_EPIFF|nr:hypothetical protein C2857_005049 [Epichloe festucae Fl1]